MKVKKSYDSLYSATILVLFVLFSSTSNLLLAAESHHQLPDNESSYGINLDVYAFMDAAFSTYVNNSNVFPEYPAAVGRSGPYDLNGIEAGYPWLSEFIYRRDGLPRYGVINKWGGSVTVSYGYPNDLIPEKGESVALYANGEGGPKSEEVKAIADNQIEKTAKMITAVTGVPISFVPARAKEVRDLGNLRVIFVDNTDSWKTKYKKGNGGTYMTSIFPRKVTFRPQITNLIPSIVWYTPYSSSQVDGFFISDSNNNIKMAFCYIWEGNNKNIIPLLIKECLVRSMGIPDSSSFAPKDSILSLWNAQENYRDTRIYDRLGEDAAFDMKILATLYRKDIVSGEDAVSVLNALTAN